MPNRLAWWALAFRIDGNFRSGGPLAHAERADRDAAGETCRPREVFQKTARTGFGLVDSLQDLAPAFEAGAFQELVRLVFAVTDGFERAVAHADAGPFRGPRGQAVDGMVAAAAGPFPRVAAAISTARAEAVHAGFGTSSKFVTTNDDFTTTSALEISASSLIRLQVFLFGIEPSPVFFLQT